MTSSKKKVIKSRSLSFLKKTNAHAHTYIYIIYCIL